jgi:methionyl-tRNA formyltransferase
VTGKKIILLSGNRVAIPLIQQLYAQQQLAAIGVPEHCTTFCKELKFLFNNKQLQIQLLNKENFVRVIKKLLDKHQAEAVIMFYFPYKIPKHLFHIPPKGFINFHPGILPDFRGPDPIFSQIINQSAFAGLTVHSVDENFDTGPVIFLEKIPLLPEDTHGSLSTKTAFVAVKLMQQLMLFLQANLPLPQSPQTKEGVYYKKAEEKDILIDWEKKDAGSIRAVVNACNPWNKGAVTYWNGWVFRIVETEPSTLTGNEHPGTVLEADKENGLVVQCSNNSSLKVNIVYSNEGIMSGYKLNQLGLKKGMVLKAPTIN